MSSKTRGASLMLGVGLMAGASVAGAQALNLYTARHYDSLAGRVKPAPPMFS
jgi:iron(III) transport system substrate-binding protein